MAFSDSFAVLDVAHGNCALIEDSGYLVVIDAGRGSALLEFLTIEELTHIDVLLISHADADHIGGLIALLASNTVTIRDVRINSDSVKDSRLWDDALFELDQKHKSGELTFQVGLSASQEEEFSGGNIGIEVLAPSPYLAGKGPGSEDRAGRRITSNTISAVIRVTKDGEPLALLPGDLDSAGLANLIEAEQDAKASILVFPHHGGSPGGDTQTFIDSLMELVSPSIVIFSIGREGAYQFPRPEVVARVRSRGSATRIVCTQLSKHCATALPTSSPSHLVGFAKGQESRRCCGGTILVPFSNVEALTPRRPEHLTFIRELAPTALCID